MTEAALINSRKTKKHAVKTLLCNNTGHLPQKGYVLQQGVEKVDALVCDFVETKPSYPALYWETQHARLNG
jgi:hypothetical protein